MVCRRKKQCKNKFRNRADFIWCLTCQKIRFIFSSKLSTFTRMVAQQRYIHVSIFSHSCCMGMACPTPWFCPSRISSGNLYIDSLLLYMMMMIPVALSCTALELCLDKPVLSFLHLTLLAVILAFWQWLSGLIVSKPILFSDRFTYNLPQSKI